MKVVFNLVKCCRDQAFDICMDGIAAVDGNHWVG